MKVTGCCWLGREGGVPREHIVVSFRFWKRVTAGATLLNWRQRCGWGETGLMDFRFLSDLGINLSFQRETMGAVDYPGMGFIHTNFSRINSASGIYRRISPLIVIMPSRISLCLVTEVDFEASSVVVVEFTPRKVYQLKHFRYVYSRPKVTG